MGYWLTDLSDADRSVKVNLWNWRPTITMLHRFGLVTDEQAYELQEYPNGWEFTAKEARAFAAAVRDQVLADLPADARVTLDGSVTREPDDGTIYRGANDHKNYSATQPWLKKFVEFCIACDGFEVS